MGALEKLVLLGETGYDIRVAGSWDRMDAIHIGRYWVRTWSCCLESLSGDVLHGSGSDPTLAVSQAFDKALAVDRKLAERYMAALP